MAIAPIEQHPVGIARSAADCHQSNRTGRIIQVDPLAIAPASEPVIPVFLVRSPLLGTTSRGQRQRSTGSTLKISARSIGQRRRRPGDLVRGHVLALTAVGLLDNWTCSNQSPVLLDYATVPLFWVVPSLSVFCLGFSRYALDSGTRQAGYALFCVVSRRHPILVALLVFFQHCAPCAPATRGTKSYTDGRLTSLLELPRPFSGRLFRVGEKRRTWCQATFVTWILRLLSEVLERRVLHNLSLPVLFAADDRCSFSALEFHWSPLRAPVFGRPCLSWAVDRKHVAGAQTAFWAGLSSVPRWTRLSAGVPPQFGWNTWYVGFSLLSGLLTGQSDFHV